MKNITKARMQQKHDVAENWNNVDEFVPQSGEFIVYDKDSDISKQRVKVGDGETSIKDLGFIAGEVYVQKKEPKNASNGAVWITPDKATESNYEEENDPSVVNSNWNIHDEDEPGYIRNRPVWYKKTDVIIERKSNSQLYNLDGMNAYYVSNLAPKLEEVSNLVIYVKQNSSSSEESWEVKGYLENTSDLSDAQISSNADQKKIFVANGTLFNLTSDSYVFITFVNNGGIQIYPLGVVIGSLIDESIPTGIYFFDNSTNYLSKVEFTYSTVKVSEIYESVFKKKDSANVYVLSPVALANMAENPMILSIELAKFKSGDIVLIPTSLLEMLG